MHLVCFHRDSILVLYPLYQASNLLFPKTQLGKVSSPQNPNLLFPNPQLRKVEFWFWDTFSKLSWCVPFCIQGLHIQSSTTDFTFVTTHTGLHPVLFNCVLSGLVKFGRTFSFVSFSRGLHFLVCSHRASPCVIQLRPFRTCQLEAGLFLICLHLWVMILVCLHKSSLSCLIHRASPCVFLLRPFRTFYFLSWGKTFSYLSASRGLYFCVWSTVLHFLVCSHRASPCVIELRPFRTC